jgi:hypothetical protein
MTTVDGFYFSVVLTTHTNYSCCKTITYLLIYNYELRTPELNSSVRVSRWSSLCSLGADHTEFTTSSSSCVAAETCLPCRCLTTVYTSCFTISALIHHITIFIYIKTFEACVLGDVELYIRAMNIVIWVLHSFS